MLVQSSFHSISVIVKSAQNPPRWPNQRPKTLTTIIQRLSLESASP